MFDDVQRGWLDGDDYVVAAEAAGVVELPESGDEDPPDRPPGTARTVPDVVLTGRWEDADRLRVDR